MVQTIKISDRLVTICNIFGINVQQLKQSLKAENSFKQGIILHFSAEKCNEAIIAYDQAIQESKKLWEAWLLRGIAMCQMGRFQEAVTSFEEVTKFQPNVVAKLAALNGKGFALTQLNRKKEALDVYNQALEIQPDDSVTLTNRNRLMCQMTL